MKKRLTAMMLTMVMILTMLPGTVRASQIISSVNLTYDVADFCLYTSSKEGYVHKNIFQYTKTNTDGVMINSTNSGLEYKQGIDMLGAEGENPVKEDRNYYMRIHFIPFEDFDWPEEIDRIASTTTYIPITELNEFKVFLNGERYSGEGYVRRKSEKRLEVGIPIANDITAISLSQDSFVYDGKAKKPGVTSARLKNGDPVNSRMYEVFYVDKNDREVTPIDPGMYYVLLKGTGIYGTGRKEFTIEVNRHVHTWDSGKITTQPTATSPGIKTYTCTSCGATKTEVIPKLSIPRKPIIKKPIASKNKIIVSWKHFKHATKSKMKIWKKIRKVQVQCAADKDFENIVKTVTVKKGKTKAAIKGLKKKTKYYVRVRYFDGAGYSAWSKVRSVRTAK